ncbi:MAG: hypothetical protein H6R05_389 [Burkholderiaceae bacterium]|nr:hypothetical protein [Burkholderiaceae bacterium]
MNPTRIFSQQCTCPHHTHRWLRGLVLCVALLFGVLSTAHAKIDTQYATMTRHSDGAYALNADFRLSLPNQLQDAINHGTALSFQVEFKLGRPRWYWSNEDMITVNREQRISYNSLTREYRVSTGASQYRYSTLSEALLNVSRISQWRILSPNQLQTGEQYQASLRMYLNTSKLPRTYQLNSLTNQGWGLNSDWYSFNFTPR